MHSGLENQTALKSIHRACKVQWTWYGPKDATWEHEDAIWEEYPHLFEDFGNLADMCT